MNPCQCCFQWMLTALSHVHMSSISVWSTCGMLAGDKSSQHECTSFVISALEALYPISRCGTYCKLQLRKAPFPHQLKSTLEELRQHPAARLTAVACFASLLRAERVNNAALARNPHCRAAKDAGIFKCFHDAIRQAIEVCYLLRSVMCNACWQHCQERSCMLLARLGWHAACIVWVSSACCIAWYKEAQQILDHLQPCCPANHQSINQSINQSTNQSINQSINQLTN